MVVLKSRWQWTHNALAVEDVERQLQHDQEPNIMELDGAAWPRVDEFKIAKLAARKAAELRATEARKQEQLAHPAAAKLGRHRPPVL